MEIKIEDLLPNCEKCNGTGQIPNPELQKNQGSLGRHLISPPNIDCNECNGNGVIITESGKVLIKFFKIAKQKYFLYY